MLPVSGVRLRNTCRLIPSRYPPAGIVDSIASPGDLEAMFELESWTNDRISAELGLIHRIPANEWVVGQPMATVVMSAYCHPRPGGGRFNGPDRGAWYAGRSLQTAQVETVYHRTEELAEVGVFETRLQMRLYLADFAAEFHDVRADRPEHKPYHDSNSYVASQALARVLVAEGSNGILYRSVRHPGGECIACFRPRLVKNVRQGAHFEYHWQGSRSPAIYRLRDRIPAGPEQALF